MYDPIESARDFAISSPPPIGSTDNEEARLRRRLKYRCAIEEEVVVSWSYDDLLIPSARIMPSVLRLQQQRYFIESHKYVSCVCRKND
jgi:hypothetical protein